MNPKFKRRLAAAVALLCFAMVMMGAKPKVQYQFGTTNNSVDLTNIIISIAGTATNADGSTITNLASGLSATNLTLYGSAARDSFTVTNAFTNTVLTLTTSSNITSLVYNTNQIFITTAENSEFIPGTYTYSHGTNLPDGYYSAWTNGYFEILGTTNGDNMFTFYWLMFTNTGGRSLADVIGAANYILNDTVDDWVQQNAFPFYPTGSYVPTNTITHEYTSALLTTGAPTIADARTQLATNTIAGLRADASGYAHLIPLAREVFLKWAETNRFTFVGGWLMGRIGYAPGSTYVGSIYGDYGYNLPGLQWLVDPNDLYAVMTLMAQSQLPNGCFPNSINLLSEPGTYNLGPLDYITFANEIYYHWRMTGSTRAYTAFEANLEAAHDYAHITNGLMWINHGEVSYYADDQGTLGGEYNGFQTMGTLGYYDAYQKLAEVSAAAGDMVSSTNYLRQCTNIVARLEAVLWDSTNRLFLAYNTSNTLDVFSSAYAVYLGAVRPAVAREIITRFGEDWGVHDLYTASGACKRKPGGSASFYAWVPYVANVLRQYDQRIEAEILNRALYVWKESSPEGTSEGYLMGPALTYGYLMAPPPPAVNGRSWVTEMSGLSSTNNTFYGATIASGDGGGLTNVPISAMFTNVYNVKEYGAAGDGVTDDTDAIQDCIDAATNAIVFWPAGTYKVAKTLTDNPGEGEWKHAITLWSDRIYRGEGKRLVRIVADFTRGANMPVFLMPTNFYQRGNIIVEGMTIDGNLQTIPVGGGGEDEGINFKCGTNIFIRDLCVTNCGQDGIDVDQSYGLTVTDSEFWHNYGCGIHMSGSGSWYTRVHNCLFVSNAWVRATFEDEVGRQAAGLDFDAVTSGSAVGCEFRHNVNDLELGKGSKDCTVSACNFLSYQQLVNTNVWIRSSRRVIVSGCNIFNNGSGSYGVWITDNSTNVTLSANTIWTGYAGTPIRITSSGTINIVGNNIMGLYGVYIDSILAGHSWMIVNNVVGAEASGSALRLLNTNSGENGVIKDNIILGKIHGAGPSSITISGNRFAGAGPTDQIRQLSGSAWVIRDNSVTTQIQLSGPNNIVRGNSADTLSLSSSGCINNRLSNNRITTYSYTTTTPGQQIWENSLIETNSATPLIVASPSIGLWNSNGLSLWQISATGTNQILTDASNLNAVTNGQASVSFGSVNLSTTHQETTWTLDDETGDTTMEVGSPVTNIVFTSAGTIKANFSGDGSGLTNLSASAISGVLTQGHSAEVTLSNAVTVIGTNYVTKLRVGGAAETADAVNVTGSIRSSSTVAAAGTTINDFGIQHSTLNASASGDLLILADSNANSTSDRIRFGFNSTYGSGMLQVATIYESGEFATTSLTATNGVVMYQLPWIPTNSIPPSSNGITNYVFLNLSNTVAGTVGGPCYVATNHSAAGSFIILKPTLTQTTWP